MFYQEPLNHDHGDITYDQTQNFVFHQKVESIWYKASLTIADPIKSSFKKKFIRQRKLCRFVKFYNSKFLGHFFKLISTLNRSYQSGKNYNFPQFKKEQNFF